VLVIDLLPDLEPHAVRGRLARRRAKDSASTVLGRVLGLDPVKSALVREATANRVPNDPDDLAQLVGALPLRVRGPEGIERAISSAGGVTFDQVDDRLMLVGRPGTFVAGEMLDWEAPTGGYLLQASFSTGVAAAEGALAWLEEG
jgi:predicted flavoprotein YhiN